MNAHASAVIAALSAVLFAIDAWLTRRLFMLAIAVLVVAVYVVGRW